MNNVHQHDLHDIKMAIVCLMAELAAIDSLEEKRPELAESMQYAKAFKLGELNALRLELEEER